MISNIFVGWALTILVLGGSVLIWWLRLRRKQARKLLPLKAFASEYNMQLSEMDSWDRGLIGIDRTGTGTLFFIRSLTDRTVREKIDLREVSGCWMSKNARTVNYHKEKVSVIDRIYVILSFNDHRPQLALEFYNDEYDSLTLTGELQLAQKWTAVINELAETYRRQRAARRKKEAVVPNIPAPVVKPGDLPGPKKGKRNLVRGRAA